MEVPLNSIAETASLGCGRKPALWSRRRRMEILWIGVPLNSIAEETLCKALRGRTSPMRGVGSARVVRDELEHQVAQLGAMRTHQNFGAVFIAGVDLQRLRRRRMVVENFRLTRHERIVGGLDEQHRRLHFRIRVVDVESNELDRSREQD